MGLAEDCNLITDRAQRIRAMVFARNQTKIFFGDNPDAEVEIPLGTKEAWLAKIRDLKAEVKAVVKDW